MSVIYLPETSPADSPWFRRLADASQDLVYVFRLDPPGYLYVSPSASALTGYTPEEYYAEPLITHRIVHPQDADLVQEVERLGTEPQMFELRIRHKDGRELWLEQYWSPLVDPTGRVIAVHGVGRDITRRKQLERAERDRAARERAQLMADKMESVGRLAGVLAHDFNNLLTVISGYASLLAEDDAATASIQAKVSEIVRATERAKELTSKLLIFSRKQPVDPKLVDVEEFVKSEAASLSLGTTGEVGVFTKLNAPETLVRIDPSQLSKVFTNLIANARDAMPSGGTLVLSTRLELIDDRRAALHPGVQPGDFVAIAVKDTGKGMEREVQAHLFEPFFTTKHIGKGTGLGLATAYALVRQSGGFIDADSQLGEGTTMTVYLPVSKRDEPKEAPAPARRGVRGGDECILLVEDEASVRKLARIMLSRVGYHVIEAANPAEAIRLVDKGLRVDLVLTDIVMPAMSGRQMITELQRLTSGFEVLYVSGYPATGGGNPDVHDDPVHFLPKPFDSATLLRKVRELLDSRLAGR